MEQDGPPLVAHAEAATAEQPGERALDHPAVPPQSLGGVNPATGNPGSDAARSQGTADLRRVVGLVGMEFGRALPRTPGSPARPDDGRDAVNEWNQLGRVVGVGRGEADRQRDTIPIHHEMVLGPWLATVDRIRPGLLAPLLARTLRLSTLARDQSRTASSPSQFNSRVCSVAQTPASCQSRNRLQQVTPLP